MSRCPYRYVLAVPFRYCSVHLQGVEFRNDWLAISQGVITIPAGYAWDGCSPKLRQPVFGLFHLGTPDGPWHHGRTPTYEASLVHDALCQFKAEVPIRRSAVNLLFDEMLRRSGWRYRWLYVQAVRWFGPRRFAGDET